MAGGRGGEVLGEGAGGSFVEGNEPTYGPQTAGFHVLKNNQRCKLISYLDLPCRPLRMPGTPPRPAPPCPDMDYCVQLSWFYEYVTAERVSVKPALRDGRWFSLSGVH